MSSLPVNKQKPLKSKTSEIDPFPSVPTFFINNIQAGEERT